jgi:PAS domain S-box-containing protein
VNSEVTAGTQRRASGTPTGMPRPPGRWFAALNIVLAVGLAAVAAYFGLVYARGERAATVDAWRGRLAAMADDRKATVARWVDERIRIARMMASYPTVGAVVGPVPDGAGTGSALDESKRHLVELLDSAVEIYGLRGCLVVNKGGSVVMGCGAVSALDGAGRTTVVEAQRRRAPVLDMSLLSDGSPIVEVVAPVSVAGASVSGSGERPTGAVVLLVDPRRWLFPFLAHEPVPTETGETLLARRDGGRIVFLSPLRRRPAHPLTFSLPAAAHPLVAVDATGGKEALGLYADYVGHRVLGAARTIPDTRWGLVVKVDQAEVLAGYRVRVFHEAVALGGIMAVLLAIWLGMLHNRRARYQVEVARSEAHFSNLFEAANDAVLFVGVDGRIVAANRKAGEMYGYSNAELLGRTIDELRAPETREDAARRIAMIHEGQGLLFEAVHLARDGRQIPVEVSAHREALEDAEIYLLIVRDVSARKADERRILALNRLLRTISEVNQLIVRERNPDRVLAEACRILVEHGGYRMAWIGLTEPPTDTVRPVASAGHVDGYLDDVNIRLDDTATGRDPTGTAIRERRPVIANDWVTDAMVKPWKEWGLERGYRASAAVPLLAGEVALGALTVYAEDPGAFDGEVVKLLVELTADLAFALQALETERQKDCALRALTQSEQRFRLLFDRISSGAVIFEVADDGTDFIIRDLNRAAQRIERVAVDGVVGRSVVEVFPGIEGMGLLDVFRRVWRTGQPENQPASVYRDERIEGWRENYVFKLPSGELVAVYDDVTARKRAEKEVQDLNRELEARVQARTAELRAANEELEAFSYSVSHDLRAPLRAIDGFSRVMDEEYGRGLDEEGRRLLGVIRANTQRMSQLIDDLLAFSRAGRHRMQRAPVDMAALAREAFGEQLPEAARARVTLNVGALPNVDGDPAMLRQVWANLLSNAVKFSAPKEKPVIEVFGEVDGEDAVYHVRDNGVGFDMQYADKLFGVFQRLHSTGEFEGTGVGLALVQRIVQRHGGRVWAEGTVGEGATFSFALPSQGGRR